ncbi:hypothetical protein SLEP1_g27135 [Rubroshorea leprosula]|uniref:Uncharacterized protein n=1 Tax=Rubroshorea leprosula TaxID=152421 RepID=A0AAV5JY44_9ROSI|nr:hypothetical protein SLEP1_g27135 [Rubroshorea leprosula]
MCKREANARGNPDVDFPVRARVRLTRRPQTTKLRRLVKLCIGSSFPLLYGFWQSAFNGEERRREGIGHQIRNPRARLLLRSSQVPPKFSASLPSPTPPALPSLSAVSNLQRCSVALCFLHLLICSPHRTCSLPSANALSPELLSAFC